MLRSRGTIPQDLDHPVLRGATRYLTVQQEAVEEAKRLIRAPRHGHNGDYAASVLNVKVGSLRAQNHVQHISKA